MNDVELEEKLKLIAEAVEKAKGDPKKEARLIDEIVDPAEVNACEGCQ